MKKYIIWCIITLNKECVETVSGKEYGISPYMLKMPKEFNGNPDTEVRFRGKNTEMHDDMRAELIENSYIRRRKRRNRRRHRRMLFLVILCLIVIAGVMYILSCCASKNIEPAASVESETAQATAEPTAKPAAGIPQASEASSNNLLDIIMEGRGMHVAYLTFDDGPNDTITPQVLDILAQYGVKATFFEVGKNIEEFPDVAKRVVAEGHLIAGHSYSHDYPTLYASEQSFADEVEKTNNLISEIYGGEPPIRLIRFPGGSYNAGDHAAEKQIYKETLKNMNYYYCDWNSLNGDAEGKAKNADELYNFFVSTIQTNNVVVLMHDAASKQETVNALPRIIEYLQSENWEFRTLADIPYDPVTEQADTAAGGTADTADTADGTAVQ